MTLRPDCQLLAQPRRAVGLAATVVCAGILAACGSSSHVASNATGSGHNAPPTTANPRQVVVTISAAHGCAADKVSVPAGPITFKVTNKDATAVSEVELQSGERIVGEKENLPPGFSRHLRRQRRRRPLHAVLPGGQTGKDDPDGDRHGGAAPAPRRRRAARRRAPSSTPRTSPPRSATCVQTSEALTSRAARQQPGCGPGRLHEGPPVLREDRAGGRVVHGRQRQPRRGHRRPSR